MQMNYIIGTILLILGIACLIRFKSFGKAMAKIFADQFRKTYGGYATDMGWDNPDRTYNKYFYRAAVIFIGLFLLMMSFHEFFGTIHLNQ